MLDVVPPDLQTPSIRCETSEDSPHCSTGSNPAGETGVPNMIAPPSGSNSAGEIGVPNVIAPPSGSNSAGETEVPNVIAPPSGSNSAGETGVPNVIAPPSGEDPQEDPGLKPKYKRSALMVPGVALTARQVTPYFANLLISIVIGTCVQRTSAPSSVRQRSAILIFTGTRLILSRRR